jgi:hypothetical protein
MHIVTESLAKSNKKTKSFSRMHVAEEAHSHEVCCGEEDARERYTAVEAICEGNVSLKHFTLRYSVPPRLRLASAAGASFPSTPHSSLFGVSSTSTGQGLDSTFCLAVSMKLSPRRRRLGVRRGACCMQPQLSDDRERRCMSRLHALQTLHRRRYQIQLSSNALCNITNE